MQKKLILPSLIAFTVSIIFFSCKRDYSCEGCINGNKPPIANAGPDQSINLPIDSVLLDGRQSIDADGTITSFQWTKISGPASVSIRNTASALTIVKNLIAGAYLFELKVTDDGGLSSRDTVQVIVIDPAQPNRPPVARAGIDQTITLPVNAVTLDGSASSDPDNNIASYAWTKISGPASFSITNPNAVQTHVTGLVEGVYQFELKVIDSGGLFSKDTLRLTVNSLPPPSACDIANRPEINVFLNQIGTLTVPKLGAAVASVGNKIVFAGGVNEFDGVSTVDIFDISLNNWTTANLSVPRGYIEAVACGDKIFFAGGYNTDGSTFADWYNTVDVYTVSSNSWSVITLAEKKMNMASVSVGNKVFFAGGYTGGFQLSKKVEIFDLSTNQWTYADLSQARESLTADVVGNKIYFAGGNTGYTVVANGLLAYPTDRVDVFDIQTNLWTIDALSQPKWGHASIAVNDKIYWAGGITYSGGIPGNASQKVDIRNITTQTLSNDCLFQVNMFFKAVRANNKIIFFTGNGGYGSVTNKFDIYDLSTNSWSIGVLPFSIYSPSVISVNNVVYVAGGWINGAYSNKVYKLEF